MGSVTPEAPKTYYFTFGADHVQRDHYVRIHGTYMDARLAMLAAFGPRWCSQHESAGDAGIAEYHLTELVLPGARR